MKKIMKRVVTLLLAATMIVSVAACGKKGDGQAAQGTIDKNTIYRENALNLDLPKDMYINRTSVGGSKMFFIGTKYSEGDASSSTFIISCNFDGSDLKQKQLDVKGWVDNIYATPDDNAYISYTDYFEDYSDPDNYVYENYNYLAKLDAEGNKLLEKDISEELDIDYISNFKVLKDGTIFIYADNMLYHLDANFSKLKEKELSQDTWFNDFVSLKDGTLCASSYGENGMEFKKLDLNTLELGDKIEVPFNIGNYSIFEGNDKYDILLRSSVSISGYNIGDQAPTELFNFVNSDIETNYFDSFASMADGSFVGIYTEWGDTESVTKVCKYTKIDPADYVEKKVLSLGVTYLNQEVRKSIVKYNKASDKYRVTVVDYSVYDTEENWMGGEEKLNSDIASGVGPDIVMSNDSSLIDNYKNKGLFVDLHKFADSDPDVDLSDIWPNLIRACETDGKLYELVPTFNIQTLVGKAKDLNGKTSWTLAEMKAFAEALPEGSTLFEGSVSRESFLNMMISIQGNDYIDMANATCKFDSPEFKEVLEYLKTLPAEADIEDVEDGYYDNYDSFWRTGKVALYTWYMSDLRDYNYMAKGYFGEDVTFIGYPCNDGKGSFLTFWMSLAISSKCKNQEAAWDFVKYYWSDEYQKSVYGIPASMKRFDEMAAEAMKKRSYTDENGVETFVDDTWYVGGTEIKIDPLTQAEVDMLKNFVSSVDKKMASFGEDVLNIISEEAEPYFQGQKSVDEVTQIIQSRLSIYLKEKQ